MTRWTVEELSKFVCLSAIKSVPKFQADGNWRKNLIIKNGGFECAKLLLEAGKKPELNLWNYKYYAIILLILSADIISKIAKYCRKSNLNNLKHDF